MRFGLVSPAPCRRIAHGHLATRLSQFALAGLALLIVSSLARAEDERITTVGMSTRIDQIILPGSELEVRPLEDSRSPIVMRIINMFRHGTAYRYDLVYYGLEPGEFDLKDYLRRRDGSSADDLPPIRVEIRAVLPPGQVEPNPLTTRASPFLGGYRTVAVAGGILWVAGLLAILFAGRKRRGAAAAGDQKPVSLAERLRPLVEAAMAGRITRSERAELERMLLAYWRHRLSLGDMNPAEAIAALRDHEESGPLLQQLEIWLHRPGTADGVDVATLLKPYQDLPADAL